MFLRAMPALVFALVLSLSVRAQESPRIKVETDITFCKLPDGKEMKLDIAYPTGNGPYPAVLCLHGGAWRFGKRQDVDSWIKYLAGDGYVAASASYRLLPDAKFPEPVEDCKTAVRFLRANAEKYQINKDKIGVLGFSAGAHLACLLGVCDKAAGFEGKEYPDQSSNVQAVVSYFGPTDLTLYGNDESAQNGIFEPWLGGRFKDKPEVYKKASPISYVKKGDPPFLFLHGTRDWLVSLDHSKTMCEKLKDAGAPAELVVIDGGLHGFIGAHAVKANNAAEKFLAEKLKK